MKDAPAPAKARPGKLELARLVLTLSALAYLVFFIGQAFVFSPDFQGAIREFIALPAAGDGVEIHRNLSYVSPTDPLRSGDLYLPKAAADGMRRPVVILIHGGSWKEGARDFEKESARYLARHGYAAFNIDYRLVGQGGEFPHDIADVKDAMAFLVEHAQQFGIDPGRIVLYGSSSGGHMAMLAAYSADNPQLPPENHPGSKARAAAVASLFGLSDVNGIYVHTNIKTHIIKYLNGKTPETEPALYAKASPLNYGRSAVPTIFAHGTDDHNVPIIQSTMMATVLKKNGIKFELVPVEGASHWFGPVTRDCVLERVIAFLNTVLKR
jgi:acetyl esterase/lipase